MNPAIWLLSTDQLRAGFNLSLSKVEEYNYIDPMEKTCKQCGSAFSVTPDDLAFFDKVSPVFAGKKELIPPPTLCPECRQQRRFGFKNFFSLYARPSSLSGKKLISMYHKDVPMPIYGIAEWWSDAWDPFSFGRTVDFAQSMISQISTLIVTAPRANNVIVQSENCDYCSFSYGSKNSYLVSACINSEDCAFGHAIFLSRDTYDSLFTYRCESCYECIECSDSYGLIHSIDCKNCAESAFLNDCIGCKHCCGCVGLRNQEYKIFNQPVPAAEYDVRVRALLSDSSQILKNMEELRARHIVKQTHTINAESSHGDYLQNCKNVRESSGLKNCEDCAYCSVLDHFKDAQDCDYAAVAAEHTYESLTCYGDTILFSCNCLSVSSGLLYCETCFSCKDCFGCVGMRNQQNCILNKQYTKEEYETLVPKIIEKMRADGEWGEFFPVTMSPFAYNETVAQAYFPMTKEEVLARGWKWRDQTDEMPKVEKILPAAQLPDSIDDIPDDILNWAIECEATKRPFKIIKQELEFYRTMRLPVPRFHPDERHRRRMALRNPRKLWDRECAKCKKPIATSYAPERLEIVYCESCYLASVY